MIEEAYRRGELDYDTALLYKATAIFEPEKLPAQYQSPTPAQSATPVLLELFKHRQNPATGGQPQLPEHPLAGMLASAASNRPVLSGAENSYNTTHFQIHYTLSGADAVAATDQDHNLLPDYVQTLGAELEYVWYMEVMILGWLHPPSDISQDGDPRFDVYLLNIQAIGYATPDDYARQGVQLGDNENSGNVTERYAASSYMALKNDSSLTLQKSVIAHEFAHAIQFGYNVWEEAWLMESTATWIMDEVHDDLNYSAGYLPAYFANPDSPLHSEGPSTHWYGDWILMRYISEHYGGPGTIRRIWESSSTTAYDSPYGHYSFNVIQDALGAVGASLPAIFNDFTVGNYVKATAPASDPYCYEEAASYPSIYIEGHINHSGAYASYMPPDGVGNYGADYIEIHSTADTLLLRIAGNSAGTSYAAQLVGITDGMPTVTSIPMSGSPASGSTVVEVSHYDAMVLIVANETPDSSQDGWASYTVEVMGEQTGQLPPAYFLAGDVQHDGIVDVRDLALLASDFNKPPSPQSHTDINLDGIVDIFDLVFAGRNYGKAAPTTWGTSTMSC